ncbi:hypothetical protein OQ637_000550 [Escherichia coli]|nr:hypothetical protein [Escherichia coli]
MFSFGVGLLSFIGLIIFPVGYLVSRLAISIGAWFEREEGPKDRVVPKIIVAAILGFLLGSFAQPKWDQISECHDLIGNWGKCVIPVPR